MQITKEQILATRIKIGAYLKAARIEKNITHYAIRKKTGVEIKVQMNLEDGKTSVTLDTLCKYCYAIGHNYLFILSSPENYEIVKDQLINIDPEHKETEVLNEN